MLRLDAFRDKVREYRRLAGHSQKELAAELGLHADVLSHKFNGIGGALLTHSDTKRIISILAEWLALSSQAEVVELLALMDLPPDAFTEAEWNAPPLQTLLPAPHTASAPPDHRLPIPLTPLLGREAEVAQISDRLCQPETRLLTLTGPGGIGKTRLALQVATLARPAFAGGVAFVPLAPVTDPAHVLTAIAQALRIDTRSMSSMLDALSNALRDQRLLLVLDNCEHVLSASDAIGELLVAVPALTVLATSRSPLHLYGEYEYPVPPLAWPETSATLPLADLDRFPALQLFAARARAVRPDFALTPANAATVAFISEQLDGLPLAIELAAARLKYLALDTLRDRLSDRLNLLAGGAHNLPPRQQTLRNTLAWSYDLLVAEERQCFARLGVFVGGFSAAAASAVCQPAGDMEALIEQLVDKSLAQIDRSVTTDEPRYLLLATIRAYALERLAANFDGDATHARHAAYYVALAETWEPEMTGPRQQEGMQLLEAAYANIRAALQWLRVQGASHSYARLCAAIWRFWWVRGYIHEGRQWLAHALTLGDAPPLALVKLHRGAGTLAWAQGDYANAAQHFARSLDLARAIGDQDNIAGALNNLGVIALYHGDYARAEVLYAESLDLRRALGDRWGICIALNNLGEARHILGDYAGARRLHAESLALRREMGDTFGMASSLSNLGSGALAERNFPLALTYFAEALSLFRELGDKQRIALVLTNLGSIAAQQGALADARAYLTEAVQLRQPLGDRAGMVATLQAWMQLLVAADRLDDVARLGGAITAIQAAMGTPLAPAELAEFDTIMAQVRAQLPAERVAALWDAGGATSLAEVVAGLLVPATSSVP